MVPAGSSVTELEIHWFESTDARERERERETRERERERERESKDASTGLKHLKHDLLSHRDVLLIT
jgi:hypothetical protein